MKKIIALSVSCLFLFYSCEKDIEVEDKSFISFEDSDDKILLDAKNNNDVFVCDNNNFFIRLGGGLSNDDGLLENYYHTRLNSFIVTFHNIQFEDIVEGVYNYNESIYGEDTLNKGVEITWMTLEKWDELIENYKQSDSYEQCLESNGPSSTMMCSTMMRGESDFYSTSNYKDQSGGHFRITRTSLKKFKQQCSCEGEGVFVYDLIIEGTFSCVTVSQLEGSHRKNISGNFRIHLPSPLKFDCPDQCLSY